LIIRHLFEVEHVHGPAEPIGRVQLGTPPPGIWTFVPHETILTRSRMRTMLSSRTDPLCLVFSAGGALSRRNGIVGEQSARPSPRRARTPRLTRGPTIPFLDRRLRGRARPLRYLLSARVRPEKRTDLMRALEKGRFGEGFPYGNLGDVLCN